MFSLSPELQLQFSHARAALGVEGSGLVPVQILQHTRHKLTLLVQRNGERYVLRIDDPDHVIPGLDRDAELPVIQWAAAAGLGVEVIAASTRHPAVMLTRYIDGRNWTTDDLRDPRQLARAGRLLRRLHDSATGLPLPQAERCTEGEALPPPPGVSLPRLIRAYAARSNSTVAHALAGQALALLATPAKTVTTLCHRDPTAPNWVETPDGELKLLDWEYAGPGDPLYDLAVIIEHHALDEAAAETLLAAWGDEPSDEIRARLGQARQAYRLVVALWEAVAGLPGPDRA